jgi:hypothetical protein
MATANYRKIKIKRLKCPLMANVRTKLRSCPFRNGKQNSKYRWRTMFSLVHFDFFTKENINNGHSFRHQAVMPHSVFVQIRDFPREFQHPCLKLQHRTMFNFMMLLLKFFPSFLFIFPGGLGWSSEPKRAPCFKSARGRIPAFAYSVLSKSSIHLFFSFRLT